MTNKPISNERLEKLIKAYSKMSFETTYAEITSALIELKQFRDDKEKLDAIRSQIRTKIHGDLRG